MAQPTPYVPAYDFTSYQAASPTDPLPADKVDIELAAAQATLDEILANLVRIQRDDGALANLSVGNDQLKAEVVIGLNTATDWLTATAYVVNDTAWNGNILYRCLVAHTSGVFATDLAAVDWVEIVDLATPLAAAAASAAAALVSEAAAAASAAAALVSENDSAASAAAALVSENAAAASAASIDLASPGPIGGTTPSTGAFTSASFTDPSATRTSLGLGTAATQNTGTSGSTVPLLDGANTWGGIQTNTAQPCFLATRNGDANNVTGNGTVFTLTLVTEVFDQGSNYDIGTYTFTAPIGGKYFLSARAAFAGITAAADQVDLNIVTSNRPYLSSVVKANDIDTSGTIDIAVVADMDINDTAYVTLTVSGEASDVVNVVGLLATIQTHFCGHLLA